MQELVPLSQHSLSLSVLNLFLQLGTAVSVSACQTIFNNRLPLLLHQYAPEVNATLVLEAGATNSRNLVQPAELAGFLRAYNQAVTAVFVCFKPQIDYCPVQLLTPIFQYFPMAACVVACLASCALEWKAIGRKEADEEA